ncbi:hypothetical protein E4631_23335 [Hymenobacter sp. UV11]|uniref:hypothetical protein n=1 Tax=Hymenobacter sp. UV11 TaxID=1849735 RepID=UPI00105F617A|nr:hypothetical protein [Hymenobacter sp. UV11]TDN39838.1 hypothetical protein A8B98_16740 [Hymenobacter sp. UV11]TFZ63240.1 hypothetical protein E4631_23335 [Hymenobacter sp. UV11]
MSQTLEKTVLVEKLPDSRTAHLQPIIDYLTAEGNTPADQAMFTYDRDGYGSYYFKEALDMARLRAHFAFPATILLTKDTVQDTRNFVRITQANPASDVVLKFNV